MYRAGVTKCMKSLKKIKLNNLNPNTKEDMRHILVYQMNRKKMYKHSVNN